MAQMTHRYAIHVYNNIKEIFGQTAADEFAQKFSLSKSADYIRKFKWAKDICNYLECKYTPEQIKTLRMSCACHPGDKEKENTKRIYDEAENLDEFCENYNREYTGHHLVWHEGNAIENGAALFFSYPTCYCTCVKRVNEPISPTWCLCTLGYTKDLFDYVLGYDTEVELIESIKTGGSRCVMRITRN
ncbi:MAG: DUF6144 family protein [Eubacteriales bacterium]|nr:DUF6144 family protein [Eubacteriales bacterium]